MFPPFLLVPPAGRLGFDLSVCCPPPTYFLGRAPGPKKQKQTARSAGKFAGYPSFLMNLLSRLLRHRQCTLHVFRRGIKSRVWKRGGSTSPELYVGPIHAIKKQSKFEKCMRKAVKKDTEMVRQAH